MRTLQALDQVLENAVAAALGLDEPHPHAPHEPRAARARPVHRLPPPPAKPRRERPRVAA